MELASGELASGELASVAGVYKIEYSPHACVGNFFKADFVGEAFQNIAVSYG